MKANEGSILEAFGYKETGEQGSIAFGPTLRPGPLPNFFVVYGLAFEIISKSFGNPAASIEAIAAAKALQTLVKPIYSGVALFASSIFDELCTLCYRIALSEGASLRLEMVQVMSNFATSRGASGDQDQIRRVVAVITFALRAGIGSHDARSNCKQKPACFDLQWLADEISGYAFSLAIGHGRCQDRILRSRFPSFCFSHLSFGHWLQVPCILGRNPTVSR